MHAAEIADAIGAKVRAGRAQLGLTRKQLAAKAEVSERYLHELENGAANASIGILAKVADALGQPPLTLIAGGDASAASAASFSPQLTGVLKSMSLAEQAALAPHISRWLAEHRHASKGVALLGLRGAGKSTIGRRFAERMGIKLVSVTAEIERRAGMGLADLFNLGGPDAYRSLENEVIADLIARDGRIVLETAGGIAANTDALDLILSRFKTVWLKALPEDHLARVAGQGDTRPMQGNPKALEHLKALLAARAQEYARAEFVIETSGRGVEACVDDLERLTGDLFEKPQNTPVRAA